MSKAAEKKSNSIDMLHGPMAKKIVLFSIPLAITSILQQLLNSTDAVFAGQWLGSNALAAVGGVAPIISLFVAVFVGLSVGVNVVIAVHIGHDDLGKIRGAVQTTAVAAVVCSLALAIAGVLSTDFILASVNMPSEAWADGAQYLHVYFVGIVFLVVYNFGSAVLRAKGDTRRPLYALAAAAVLNIAFDYAAVELLGAGVFGIAVGTVVADAVCAAIIVYFLLTEEETYRLTLKGLHVVSADMKTLVHIGLPAALQGAVFALSNIIIQGEINGFGADATAGSSAAMNFEFYTYFFVNAFSQAAVTFIGQNFAAGQHDRCDKVTRIPSARSRFGSTKPQTPAILTTINAPGDTNPASTAAVPTTIPPMVDTDWPMAWGRWMPDSCSSSNAITTELSISAVTAVFGAPVVIGLLIRRNQEGA